jgi:hypothetical protein
VKTPRGVAPISGRAYLSGMIRKSISIMLAGTMAALSSWLYLELVLVACPF